jgi:hypothetical protein
MKYLIFVGLILISSINYSQPKEWSPVAGFGVGAGTYMLQGYLEAGVVKNRFMGLVDITHYHQGITAYGIKTGVLSIYKDYEGNDVFYLIGGWGIYTDKEKFTHNSAILAVRWQYYNVATELGYKNDGIYFTIGWQFKKI